MQQEIKTELSLENKRIEQNIRSIFQEIKEGYLIESNDILADLNPLISQLQQTDKTKVIQALNKYFRDFEFVRIGGYWLQGEINLKEELIDYKIVYHSDREKNNYESIIQYMKVAEFRRQNMIPDEFLANLQQLLKLKEKSLLVFDLLDYGLNNKELNQIEILKILLEIFYCNTIFNENELQVFEQLIGFLLQKQLYEISYYIELLKNNDPQNFTKFVQLLQQLQLKIINKHNEELLKFLNFNQRYNILLMNFDKEIINVRSQLLQIISSLIQIPIQQCQFNQIISYISNIENVNDQLNDLYLLIVFYYWKKYSFKYNLQNDLKNQEDGLPNINENQRKFKFIERFLNKQKSNLQDKIYLFVIHRICYFVEEIGDILCQDTYEKYKKIMGNNMKNYKDKKQYLISFLRYSSKFFEYWKIIHSLKFYKQEISPQDNQIDQLITNLFWINNQSESLFMILKMLTSNKNRPFFETVQLIDDEINQIPKESTQMDMNILKINFLRILYAQSPQEQKNYFLLRNLIENYGSLFRASMILEASQFLQNKLNYKSIQFFAKIGRKFIVIHKIFPNLTLQKLAQDLVDYISSSNQVNIYECLLILKSIFAIKQVAISESLQFIRILIKNICIKVLGYLIVVNKNKHISLTQVKWTIYAILNLFQKLEPSEFFIVEKCLDKLFKDKTYNFPFVVNCLRNKINFQMINQIVLLQYYLYYENQSRQLLQLTQQIFQQDEQLYEQWFLTTKPSLVMYSIEYLKVKKSQSYYPKQMNIPLEDFNLSISEYNELEQKQILVDWIQEMTNKQKFQKIIPLFFNIIKRGESPRDLLIYANQILQNFKQIANGVGCFNLKSLFQIFFNNANDELRVVLMKFYSKEYPIPFLFQNPIIDNLRQRNDILMLNSNLYYLIEQGYTIINLSLSQNQKKIGKTDLINQIFYEREKFETSDTCQMNLNTIDLMLDFEFNNSRNFIVADVHGTIIFEILIKILPFFKFWIVQMDSWKELQENLDQIRIILSKIGLQIKNQLEICFIVRNTEEEQINKLPSTYIIESNNIKIFYVHNLIGNQIDKQFRISEIQNVSKFLFNIILDHQKKLEKSNLQYQNQKEQFYLILQQFNYQYDLSIQQINQHQQLVNKIYEKLNLIVKEEEGFYSKNAFPIRCIQSSIKKLRNQNYELCLKPRENKIEIENNKQKMQILEQQIKIQNPTDLLMLFCEIFQQKHYYIVYLWILDKIREFNEKNLVDLQQKEYELNEKFNQLKQEKRKIKQKYLNDLQQLCEDKRNKKIKDEMSKLKQQMQNNTLNISQKNVGIELFWRELICLKNSNSYDLNFDSVEKISQLVKKGESLEFLDGDTLSINIEFLYELENKITQNKQEKILVISILGPQSSGKSTILNKIFGCHFWASVGRCTKGIHLQILKVQNKQIFQNRFDQILILDTEGLQNPNQIDPEFDKKIALFVLSISDIIMINVKGEMNQQFKSLVEMCIFTLGHLKNGLSMFKQLSWFFNQNDNYKKIEPFKQQIKDLAQNLNLQWNENYFDQQEEYIDYADILDIKDNVSGLGFASDQKDWGKNGWNQSVMNHTFSREAYQQGIKMIKQFISKLQDQKDQLNNFNTFIQNVQRNWESIEKLPDLLEFSELIQHQQNLIMKKYFDEIWKMQNITEIGESLFEKAQQTILSQNQIVFDFYKQIKQEIENDVQSTYAQIKNAIVEQMNSFKSENKIQKKVMQKYLSKLENMINSDEFDCKLKISNLIQKYEEEYQQRIGYIEIDNFIQSVLNDEEMKKKFQGNNKLIEQEFKIKWEQYINDTSKASEQQYFEMVYTQHKVIKSISNQYILNTKNEYEYLNYFRDTIIKQNPYDIQNREQEKIFQLFKQEFQQTEQFIVINKKTRQTLAYCDIFYQNISEKLNQSKDQLLDLKSFYSQEITYYVISKFDINNYFNHQFQLDFFELVANNLSQANLKTKYYNFISILDYLKIQYDKKLKEELDNLIINPSTWQQAKQIFINRDALIQDAFDEFLLTFKSQLNQEIDLSGQKFGQTFKHTYKNLNITKQVDKSNTLQRKKDIQQNYIIIDSQIEIKSIQSNYQESFNYIKSAQGDIPTYFRKDFPKQFNKIMIDQNGWNNLYNELYNLIKNELGSQQSKLEQKAYKSNQQSPQNKINEDENIQSCNSYLITGILQKIENNIKIKYNNQFALFGVILTDVGERCIYYYSMLILWRFFCYQRWNSKQRQSRHQKNYQNELIRCIAEINQDNEKQSCIKATELVNKIQITLKNQFLDRTKKEVLQKMSSIGMTNIEVVANLDKELLISVNEKTFKDQQFQQKILSYTTDHKSYIINYTQDKLRQFQLELLEEYSIKFRKELHLYLMGIQANAKTVFKYIKKHQKKTIKYFKEDNNQKDNTFYENYIFRLLMQCLLGRIENKIDIIEQQYQEIFQVNNYNPVNSQYPVNWQFLNPQDQQVYNLKTFVETLIQQIEQILVNIDQISFIQSEYQLDVEFGKLKLQMNGCEYTCPCCKRKCDQDNDNSHTHKCSNGHQIRGINGILISNNSPSLFTCEEILDECKIKTLETNLQKTWKEVKKAHSSWNFQNFNDEQNTQNKDKWKTVWNIGLGKLICSHLEKQLNHEVIFSQKKEFEILVSNIHYILILDDSGSMQGDKWKKAKDGALNVIKQIENTDCAKVSVIIFNGDARIVAECQKPNYNDMNAKIAYKGGGTNFEHPFKLALNLINKNQDFNKISILFYTDGEAAYPSIVDQFCQLPQHLRQLINLTACSGEQSSQTLALIIEKFSQVMQSAELNNSIQPIDLQRVWTEVVSKNIHQQLA